MKQAELKIGERMAAVETKLEEHCKSQQIADQRNDDAHLRIESKIDSLPDKVAILVKGKADKEAVEEIDKKVEKVDSRFWAIVSGVLMAMIVALISLVYSFYKK